MAWFCDVIFKNTVDFFLIKNFSSISLVCTLYYFPAQIADDPDANNILANIWKLGYIYIYTPLQRTAIYVIHVTW